MTGKQYIDLCEELLTYNGKVNRVTRNIFIKRLRQSNYAVNQAIALFGERGVYNASAKDINQFVADTTKQTLSGINKSKYQKYDGGEVKLNG